MNPYKIMGIPVDATRDDIMQAYRDRAKTAHPDAGGTVDRWTQLQEAHNILRDPERRAKWDKVGLKNETLVTPAKVKNFIQITLNAVVEAMTTSGNTDDPTRENIKEKVLASMGSAKHELDRKIIKISAKLKRATELHERFIFQGTVGEDEDIIGDILLKEKERVEADLSMHLDAVEVNRLAIETFGKYRYKVGYAAEEQYTPHPTNPRPSPGDLIPPKPWLGETHEEYLDRYRRTYRDDPR